MKKLVIFLLFITNISLAQTKDTGYVKWKSASDTANLVYINAQNAFYNAEWVKSYHIFVDATNIEPTFYYAYIGAATAAYNVGTQTSIFYAKQCLKKANNILIKKLETDPTNRALIAAKIKVRQIDNLIKNKYY